MHEHGRPVHPVDAHGAGCANDPDGSLDEELAVGGRSCRALSVSDLDARYLAGGHYAWKAIKGPVKLFESTMPS